MSVDWLDSNHTVMLTSMSSFRPPEMARIEMPVSTAQQVVTSQGPTKMATNISANATNPLSNSTNCGAGGHPTCHEWVWF